MQSVLSEIPSSGTMVHVNLNHTPLISPEQVTEPRKAKLRDLVEKIKAIHTSGVEVADEDMDAFVRAIFSMSWNNTRPHNLPDENMWMARFGDKAVAVGRLNSDIPSPRRRPIPVERRAGATAYYHATQQTNKNDIVHALIDRVGKCIPRLQQVDFFPRFPSKLARQMAANAALDEYLQRRVHTRTTLTLLYTTPATASFEWATAMW